IIIAIRRLQRTRSLLTKSSKYADSIKFVGWAADILERIPKTLSVADQLERASSSISLNISEGNGKFTSPDRCHFFDTARGSGLECAACLDVLVSKRITTGAEVIPGKEILRGIVSLLVGLIRTTSSNRLHEKPIDYRAANDERVRLASFSTGQGTAPQHRIDAR